MKKLILASGNAGKLREIQAILAPLGCEVLTQAELGIADAEEPHLTFIENKNGFARKYHRASPHAQPMAAPVEPLSPSSMPAAAPAAAAGHAVK